MASILSNMEIDININMNREHSALSSKFSSRSFSISLSTSSILYLQYMKINNDLPEEIFREPIDSSQLSYAETAEVGSSVSPAANKKSVSNSQHICNETTTLKKVFKSCSKDKGKQTKETKPSSSKNMINI